MTDARSPLRTLRAALFAAICISLAAMGHSYTSGHDLPLTVLLPAFPVTTALAWVAARRRRGTATIGLGLLAVQGGLHLVFARVQSHGPAPAAHGGTGHEPGPAMDLLGPSPVAMVTAHLLGAAFCALWLARGEAAFLRLAGAVGALAFTPLRPPVTAVPLPGAPRLPVRTRTAARLRPGVLLGHTLVRRGPPASAVFRATVPGVTV
ncbi:hypothetical protein [Streptomyces yaizuensis]|uniref:Membrane protein n=1 Tax=Streptomyces yaizuensis TaxID=2989713 RepID=A0ABQ5NUY0_9ACTN|nr:hypothetical protein [Streptomyces sp. YSPA8]GLF94029.1 membrane protein [Streptomyces sp. YSPA8]